MTRSPAPVPALLLAALVGVVVALAWPEVRGGSGISVPGALLGIAVPTLAGLVLLVLMTERGLRASARAEQEGRRLEEIMRRVPAAISLQDEDGVFVAVNAALVAHYGAAYAEQIVGNRPRRGSLHEVDDDFHRVLDGEVAVETVRRSEARDGTETWFSSTLVPFPIDEERRGVLHVASDVTEVRQVQQRLEHVLTRALSDFIPVCSSCGNVRVEDGDVDGAEPGDSSRANEDWAPLESYVASHTDAQFSHTFCPDCAARLYGDALPELRPDDRTKPDADPPES